MRFLLRNKYQIKVFAAVGMMLALGAYSARPIAADTTTATASNSGTASSSGTTNLLTSQKQLDQQKLQQLNQQIGNLQSQISATQKQKASLQNTLALYDAQIRETQIQVQVVQTNIDNSNIEIQQTQDQINQRTQQISGQKLVLGDLLSTLDENQQSSGLQLALGSGTFSDFLNQLQYTTTIENKVYTLVEQIKDLKTKLQQEQTTLQANLQQLQTQQQALLQTQATLTDQRTAQQGLLNETKGRESNYQKLLAASQDEQAQINKEINDLDQKIQGKPGFNSLQPIHGILAYPVQGVLTQGYGNTGFTALGYSFHNGIDIAGPPGAPVSAAADGVVYATGTGQAAYGNWVAIKHDITATGGHQIITLYGHMRSFIVSAGQPVKQGDIIGYEGNTGNTTRLLYHCDECGYHVHFSVFDATDFGIAAGAYPKVYGPYQVPYGYTYNPLDFL